MLTILVMMGKYLSKTILRIFVGKISNSHDFDGIANIVFLIYSSLTVVKQHLLDHMECKDVYHQVLSEFSKFCPEKNQQIHLQGPLQ